MVQFRVYAAIDLKNQVESIWKFFPKAFIAFSEDEVRISASDEDAEIDALLIINPRGFFDEYHCSNSRVIEVDPKKFCRILSLAEYDDQILVALKDDESAVPFLEFRINDSNNNVKQLVKLEAPESLLDKLEAEEVVECRTLTHQRCNKVRRVMKLEASESPVDKWEDEEVVQHTIPTHPSLKLEASINPRYFREAVHRTTQTHPLLTITIVKNQTLTLSSGGDIIRVMKQEGNSENHVVDLCLYRHMGAFKVASKLSGIVSGTVKLKFATNPSPCILLQFPISPFSNLSFYFPPYSYKNVVLLKVLAAGTVMEMLKSIPNMDKTVIVQFSPSQVSFYVQDVHKEALVLLKADLFTEFQCSRLLAVRADLVKLASVVNSMEVDDRVCIFVKDEEPITCIGFNIRNSKTKKNVTNKVHCLKVEAMDLSCHKCVYEYEVCMNTQKFREIVAFSGVGKEPITITLTSERAELHTKLVTYRLLKENESDYRTNAETCPPNISAILHIYPHEKAFIRALLCNTTDFVKLRGIYKMLLRTPGPQLSLEFSMGPLCTFIFNFC